MPESFAKLLGVLGLVLAAAIAFNYAATPSAAAIQAVRYPGRAAASVARVNVVGSYATVLLHGAVVEGAPFSDAILLQKFYFGWQPLDAVDSRCALTMRRIDRKSASFLMRGMPALNDQPSCKGGYGTDYGPLREVEAVRKIARGPFIPFVAVYRDWAKSDWYGAGGGEHYYRLRHGTWRPAFGGGGAYSTEDLSRYGVPRAAWCPFEVYDAKCR